MGSQVSEATGLDSVQGFCGSPPSLPREDSLVVPAGQDRWPDPGKRQRANGERKGTPERVNLGGLSPRLEPSKGELRMAARKNRERIK
jgi:hypothetical protein